MKNKFPFPLSFLTVSLFYWISAPSSVAAPFVSIGDNTDIYFNGSSSIRWASNIFRNEAVSYTHLTLPTILRV